MAKTIHYRKMSGWTKTGDRYFYQGKRKSKDSFTAAKDRRAKREQVQPRPRPEAVRPKGPAPSAADVREAREAQRLERLQGWASVSQFERAMNTKQAQRWIVLGDIELDPGTHLPPIDSDFARYYREAMKTGWDRSARGPFAFFLEWLGLRDEGADYDVGETDEV